MITDLIFWFCNRYPEIVKDMKETEHSVTTEICNPFHIEGSIWTHTMMVLKQAEFFNASKDVIIACLLHDIGKPYTAEIIDLEEPKFNNGIQYTQKKTFKNHEGMSYFLAIDILKEMVKENKITELEMSSILKLISLHGILYNYITDSKPTKEKDYVQKFSTYIEYMNAVELTKCDSMGRFFLDSGRSSAPKLGTEIFNADTYVNNYAVRRKRNDLKLLEVLIGLPGSGKSTYCSQFPEAMIISRDNTLMEYAQTKGITGDYNSIWKQLSEEDQKEIDSILTKKFSSAIHNKLDHIIIDMTNMSVKSRRKWTSGANTKNYFHKATVFNTSINECLERNSKREGKKISMEVLNSMAKKFIIPTPDMFDEIKMRF